MTKNNLFLSYFMILFHITCVYGSDSLETRINKFQEALKAKTLAEETKKLADMTNHNQTKVHQYNIACQTDFPYSPLIRPNANALHQKYEQLSIQVQQYRNIILSNKVAYSYGKRS